MLVITQFFHCNEVLGRMLMPCDAVWLPIWAQSVKKIMIDALPPYPTRVTELKNWIPARIEGEPAILNQLGCQPVE